MVINTNDWKRTSACAEIHEFQKLSFQIWNDNILTLLEPLEFLIAKRWMIEQAVYVWLISNYW